MIDWQFGILLLAIALTWLAWRRARRQAQLERARAATLAEPRWQYRLVTAGAAAGVGPGFGVETLEGEAIPDDRLDWERHGLQVIPVGRDASHASHASPAPPVSQPADGPLEAGTGVHLVAIRDGDAVEVRDDVSSRHVATLHGDVARAVADRLDQGELTDCIVLREPAGASPGGEWRLLLVHRDAAVEA